LVVSAPRTTLADDPGADHLDALLCAVQASRAWLQRDNNFGVSGQIDLLEGWMVDPSLHDRQGEATYLARSTALSELGVWLPNA
jgi:predicted RNase H-like nuclease